MEMENLELLYETLSTIKRGSYSINGATVRFSLKQEQIEAAQVFLPNAVEEFVQRCDQANNTEGACRISCENKDSFALACQRAKELGYGGMSGGKPDILVLNMANSFNPGGGVRFGASAQEEDLCRASTLLYSLESEAAKPYYEYNRRLNSHMGSNALIISPWVEVFRRRNGEYLDEPTVVSVLSCAAPVFQNNRYGLTGDEYNEMIYQRIRGMLCTATHLEYSHLVLGAFGCGAFNNDPEVVSGLFKKAIGDVWGRFRQIDFAVLDHSSTMRNYIAFSKCFESMGRE